MRVYHVHALFQNHVVSYAFGKHFWLATFDTSDGAYPLHLGIILEIGALVKVVTRILFFFCFKISDYVDKRLSFEIVNRIRWAYQAQVFCTSRWSQPSQFSAKTTTFSKISTVTIAESKYVKAALQLLLQVYYYEATRR